MKLSSPQLVGVFLVLMAAHTSATVRYVDLNSTNATPPYDDWSIAATNIQDAVDTAVAGDLVLVANGVYATGGRVVYGSLTNRVVVDKAVAVQSVNGPAVTIIQGHQVPDSTNGDGAVRCLYLTDGASISGFTLTNGATRNLFASEFESSGSGVYCVSSNAVLTNCVLSGNSCDQYGGGAYQGTFNNCAIAYNAAISFGGSGGGVYQAILKNCAIVGNLAGNQGGGVYNSTAFNCLVVSNQAAYAGGVDWGFSGNCTIVANKAINDGGGVKNGRLYNCIIYYNTAPVGSNYSSSLTTFIQCCTAPSNFSQDAVAVTNEPVFVDLMGGNFRLQTNSPCINSGVNNITTKSGVGDFTTIGPDLDGNPRIGGGTVDIGAYELQSPSSVLPYYWLQQYGLPTDGLTDYADSDGDGLNNWQEYFAQTNPTNALSVLKILSIAPDTNLTRVTLTWQCVASKRYFVQRSTNLTTQPAFITLSSNLTGPGVFPASYTDITATNVGPYFYRVGVQ